MAPSAPEVTVCPTRSWRDLAAPIASAVCFVHCVGLAVLAPVLPGTLALVFDDPRLEWILWGTAAALSAWMLLRSRALVPSYLRVAWLVAAAVGVAGLVRDNELLQPLSLVGFGAGQVVVFLRRYRAHHAADPAGAAHDHSCCAHGTPAPHGTSERSHH